MALCIALFSNKEEQETEASAQTEQSGETGVQSDEQSSQSVEQSAVQPSQSEEERQSSVCEEGIFTNIGITYVYVPNNYGSGSVCGSSLKSKGICDDNGDCFFASTYVLCSKLCFII